MTNSIVAVDCRFMNIGREGTHCKEKVTSSIFSYLQIYASILFTNIEELTYNANIEHKSKYKLRHKNSCLAKNMLLKDLSSSSLQSI